MREKERSGQQNPEHFERPFCIASKARKKPLKCNKMHNAQAAPLSGCKQMVLADRRLQLGTSSQNHQLSPAVLALGGCSGDCGNKARYGR
jgi:hypothetical protein